MGCQESVESFQPWSGQVPFAVIHGFLFKAGMSAEADRHDRRLTAIPTSSQATYANIHFV